MGKYTELGNRLEAIEIEIFDLLELEVKQSPIQSKFINSTALKVNVFNYVELVVLNDHLTFIDSRGLQHNIDCDVELTDLIDILNTI